MIFHGGTHRSYGIRFNRLVTSVTCLQACQSEFGITIGTGVSTWADQSAGAHNYTNASGPGQPAFIQPDAAGLNGYPCLRGDGTASFMSNTTWVIPAPGTTPTFIWMIARPIVLTNARRIIGGSGSNYMYNQISGTGGNVTQTGGNIGTGFTVAAGFQRFELWYNNATSDYIKIGPNSVTGTNAGNTGGTGRGIFGSAGGSLFNGDIAAIMYFSGLPSNAELALLNSACITKYGNKVKV